MKLIVCSKDIDATLIKGDLISWRDDAAEIGNAEGLYNALSFGAYPSAEDYLTKSPFTILTLPLITYEDMRPIIEEVVHFDFYGVPIADIAAYYDVMYDSDIQTVTTKRKWKIDDSALELRANGSTYAAGDISPTKSRWTQVIKTGLIRRDTLNAYREITRADIVIGDILVAR